MSRDRMALHFFDGAWRIPLRPSSAANWSDLPAVAKCVDPVIALTSCRTSVLSSCHQARAVGPGVGLSPAVASRARRDHAPDWMHSYVRAHGHDVTMRPARQVAGPLLGPVPREISDVPHVPLLFLAVRPTREHADRSDLWFGTRFAPSIT